MDDEAGRISELVAEAYGLVRDGWAGRGDTARAATLEHLRDGLKALAACTADDQAAEAAGEVAADIDRMLARWDRGPGRHAA